jgi:hypothetical protein
LATATNTKSARALDFVDLEGIIPGQPEHGLLVRETHGGIAVAIIQLGRPRPVIPLIEGHVGHGAVLSHAQLRYLAARLLELSGSPEGQVVNTCNLHIDCDRADQAAAEYARVVAGAPLPGHCYVKNCEQCTKLLVEEAL